MIIYSEIFFATDLLSERYGRREANRAVMLGFGISVIFVALISISLLFQPSTAPETAEFSSEIHQAFLAIFYFTPRFVFGSLFAYLISQRRLDVWLFHWFRNRTDGRHLWLRNNGSIMMS